MSGGAWPTGKVSSATEDRIPWVLVIVLATGSFLPSLVFFVFQASSGALGLMAASAFMLGMALLGIDKPVDGRDAANAVSLLLLLLGLIALHGAVAGFIYPPDIGRSAASSLALALMIFTAMTTSYHLFEWDDDALRKATNLLRLAFYAIGLYGIVGWQPAVEGLYAKPVFPFTEPSHYALAFTPLLIDGCVRYPGWKRYALLLASYGIAFSIQSLSLLVGTTLAAFICLPLWQLAAGSAAAFAITQWVDVQYFADRLDFSYESGNLSTLVYIQGWELVQEWFDKTRGWGVGFQQLGFVPLYSPTSDIIFQLLKNDSNLRDGGFTASKLLSEFGVFALLPLFLFAVIALKAAWRLRLRTMRRIALPAGEILACSFLAAYALEMFVRGIGYFSGTTLFTIAAYRYLRSRSKEPGAAPAFIPFAKQ